MINTNIEITTTLIYFSFFIICVISLIKSKKIIDALMSFFAVLLNFIFLFFYIKSDYVGVIIMIVYFGAIIIFFAFAVMTIDSRYFEENSNKKENFYNITFNNWIKNISFAFITYIFFYVHFKPIKNINFKQNISSSENININFSTNSFFSIYETHAAQAIGKAIYTNHVYALNTLGVILFVALVCSLTVLKYKNKKNDYK